MASRGEVVAAQAAAVGRRGRFGLEEEQESDSSSIGASGESPLSPSSDASDGGGDGGEEEVQSRSRSGGLESVESLDESIPVKRGLSNFFNGKSKSFASLSEAAALVADDLAKPENPFNKRRRMLMASKSLLKRRASCSSLNLLDSAAPSRMPPPVPNPGLESMQEGDEDEEEGSEEGTVSALRPRAGGRQFRDFRSPRSYSVGDLHKLG